MIEVFRFMDSSATSHPVYGIEHSGDAIDTAAIVYLGTSGRLPSTQSDLVVVKNNKTYHIGGWPEELTNNVHWYYNGTKYDIRSQFMTTGDTKSIGNMKAGFNTSSSNYVYFAHDFGGLKTLLSDIYNSLGREYRVKIPIGLWSSTETSWTRGSTYVTKDSGINYQALRVSKGSQFTLETFLDWEIQRKNSDGLWTHIGYIHIDPSQLPDPFTQFTNGLCGWMAASASGNLIQPTQGWWAGTSAKTIKMTL